MDTLESRVSRNAGFALYQPPEEYRELMGLYEARDEIEAEQSKAAASDRRALAVEWEKASQEIQAKEAAFCSALAERGQAAVHLLRSLKHDLTAAKEEVKVVAEASQRIERRQERVKALVLGTLTELGLKKLQGPTWHLTVAANGGVQPLAFTGEPQDLPLELRARVAVDAEDLKACLLNWMHFALDLATEEMEPAVDQLLRDSLWKVTPPAPNLTRVREVIEETGVVPEGFSLLPRGSHLSFK